MPFVKREGWWMMIGSSSLAPVHWTSWDDNVSTFDHVLTSQQVQYTGGTRSKLSPNHSPQLKI